MKQLHVIALGNALVDLEFQISEEKLLQTGLRKAGMTLASAQEQQSLLNFLDSENSSQTSGGSAANTIIAIAQFGGKTGYKTLVGQDAYGNYYTNEFTDLGVELYAASDHVHPTGTSIVLVTPDGERTMQTSLGINTLFSRENLQLDAIKRSEWLYIEGYKFSEPSAIEAIEEAVFYAKKYDTNIAITASDSFIVDSFHDEFVGIAKHANVIFANEVEATSLTKTETRNDAYRLLCEQYPNVVLTLSAEGSQIFWMNSHTTISAYSTTVVNTNGAGDMYAGGFLYGITHNHSIEKSGALASYAASKIIAQHGARLKSSAIDIRNTILGS